MLNIKKIITASGILFNNFISLSLIIMFCWIGYLYAQMPGDFPQRGEFDHRYPLNPGESSVFPSAISENVEFVGATGGAVVEDVFVQGNYAYLCAGNALVILDISVSAHPRKIGNIALPDIACDVYVSGSYAYVADWDDGGLRVIDVSSPKNPREVGFYDTPGSAKGVYVSDSYAYVADSWSGLRVIDVSTPSSPKEMGFCETPGTAYDVCVSDSCAYVADYIGGLRIVDVSSPSSPKEAGFYETPMAYNVYVSGSYAYVANYDGLRVIDVSSPSNPKEVGFYNMPSTRWQKFLTPFRRTGQPCPFRYGTSNAARSTTITPKRGQKLSPYTHQLNGNLAPIGAECL